MRRYNILMLAPHLDLTSQRGGAIHQRELIDALEKCGNKITIICQNSESAFIKAPKAMLPLLTLFTFVKTLLLAKKFDVIHDRGYLLGGAGVWAGRILDVPIVLQVDDNWIEADKSGGHLIWKVPIYEKIVRFWMRKFVKRADAIVVVSKVLKNVVVKDWKANPKKVFVIRNGVNLNKFNPNVKDIRKELGIEKNKKILTLIGEMAPWHGVIEIVKTVELLDDSYIAILVGDVKIHHRYMQKVKEYVKKKGLEQKIIFLGTIDYEKIPGLLAASDILLAPYIQKEYHYGFSPLKLFEYMAMEKPIITSNLDWIREIVGQNAACLLHDPSDSEKFAGKIRYLVKNKKYAKRIAKKARDSAVTKYSWNQSAKKTVEIYKKLLKG